MSYFPVVKIIWYQSWRYAKDAQYNTLEKESYNSLCSIQKSDNSNVDIWIIIKNDSTIACSESV